MNITLKPGHYVLAVSGGVDSMVLLDLARRRPSLRFTVAHFDHGIRDDSHLDRKLVQEVAKEHGLPFVFARENLGKDASEAKAREARYAFLHKVKDAVKAHGIITAHHQDDLLETATHNLMRGTGRKGLSSLKSTDGIFRPLLKYPKSRIQDHAKANKLRWREDATNADTTYTRNNIRHNILTKMTPAQKAQYEILLHDIAKLNDLIDKELEMLLHVQPHRSKLDRAFYTSLPHAVALELMHYWLTSHEVPNLNRKRIEQLVVAAKNAKPGTQHDASKTHKIHVSQKHVRLKKQSKP